MGTTEKIWPMDNPPSKQWPLYTRGNVGEVFPEVVLNFTWDLFGQAAEDGWRDAYERFGLIAPGDFSPDEPMVILSVFGGYCYINASYVRLVGVRAPGGTVEAIDHQFFGESEAPDYVARPGDKNLAASLRLGRKVIKLLRSKSLPELEEDKRAVRAYQQGFPGPDASDSVLLKELAEFPKLFRQLFGRHIEITFSVALVSGLLQDLCIKAEAQDKMVALLGGIGQVESAAPSSAMWKLAQAAKESPVVNAAFDADPKSVLTQLGDSADASQWLVLFAEFIAEFGSRGPNEWDLGSDSWEFRPQLALAAIDRMRGADASHQPSIQGARLAAERNKAIGEVRDKLNVVDRFAFDKALRSTTLFSQGRERSKTTIIRALHEARKGHRILAARAAERGGSSSPQDSCLLTFDEFKEYLENPESHAATIAERSITYEKLTGLIPPFIIDGPVPPIETWETRGASADIAQSGSSIKGIPGCPGIATGRARIVLDPADPGDLGPGDVLVAPITDPSWTPLFLAADAVVVDVGAVMSHAIIVSRELGIPCVVSATDATRTIPDGAQIEVNGSTGEVKIL